MKRRKVKLKTPNVFAFRCRKENLQKLKDIQEELGLDNRNMTINHIIDNFWLYIQHRDFIKAVQRMVKA